MAKNEKWTQEESDFVKNNMGKMKEKEIAKALNRTVNAIKARKKLIRKGITVVKDTAAEGKEDSTCPCCKSNKAVNEVTTYDPRSYNTIQAYYCMECGIEFMKNGTIIPYTKREALGGTI